MVLNVANPVPEADDRIKPGLSEANPGDQVAQRTEAAEAGDGPM